MNVATNQAKEWTSLSYQFKNITNGTDLLYQWLWDLLMKNV